MLKHLVVADFGRFVGLTGQRLVVYSGDETIGEYSLNRLKSVTIAKSGVSLSSNVILALSLRGIHLFITDGFGGHAASLSGAQSHGTSKIRAAQYDLCDGVGGHELARRFVYGKLRNQRAVLLYFNKYSQSRFAESDNPLVDTAEKISVVCSQLMEQPLNRENDWRSQMMGYEGVAAKLYWAALRESDLLGGSFQFRSGRGADEVHNAALNYGYAILQRYVWQCLINSGLDIYCGFLHVQRPGRPALVLDVMEEYRPWVVDRSVIKLRRQFAGETSLKPKLKKAVAGEVLGALGKKYIYRKKQLTLESIVQRQVYRLCGHCFSESAYRSYHFKW